ncbi:protein synthesis inhibitor II-like [Panicum virgatum]|uniref:rRNA N-glycosylase n=1 Tax=Panicum virgatum TaxID=38727 RepID=A0A8T0RAZ1_PANVG|nr:protein synthesis inhibitor II-like [Panicum virgatum]KAG2582288.1 hypothetical protein PVAP13_6KG126005 [Panicum virgatum]
MAAANPPSATNPLFTVTFDVQGSDNYGDFIAGIRRRVANPRHFSHNRPVLPPVEPPPRRWFHIVLRTQIATLTLTTRADNLYLEGFRSSDGTWWELTRGLIPGATYVGFGGSYGDLLGNTFRLAGGALERLGPQQQADAAKALAARASLGLAGVELGPQQMADAANALAARARGDLASGKEQQRASEALVVILLMVHEATRFATVSAFVAALMHPRAAMKRGTITAQMEKQVNGWEDLSKSLLMADAVRPPGPFKPFPDMGVSTVEEAAATIAILLFVELPGGMTAAKALQLFHGN